MLTDRDYVLARVALMRWMILLGNDIPMIWDAGFTGMAISAAEKFNEARDTCIKLGVMRNAAQAERRAVLDAEATARGEAYKNDTDRGGGDGGDVSRLSDGGGG